MFVGPWISFYTCQERPTCSCCGRATFNEIICIIFMISLRFSV